MKLQEVTMWSTEHSVETAAAPEQIWRLWADVAGWPEWNGDIERIELEGEFAAGSRILMTPIGEETVELLIAEAIEPELFVDEADMGEIVVRTTHRSSGSTQRARGSPTAWRSPAPARTVSDPRSVPRSAATFRRRSPGWSRAPNLEELELGRIVLTLSPIARP
jgi:hypothetical protein